MSEEELQLLITLDDPGDGPEEDNFHLQAKDALEYWFGDNDAFKVTFGEGDWTCTLSRLSGSTKENFSGFLAGRRLAQYHDTNHSGRNFNEGPFSCFNFLFFRACSVGFSPNRCLHQCQRDPDGP